MRAMTLILVVSAILGCSNGATVETAVVGTRPGGIKSHLEASATPLNPHHELAVFSSG